jgi:uncharacterized protein involved in exopolysaccharide biosynthesis
MTTETTSTSIPHWQYLLTVVLRQRRFILLVTLAGTLACMVVLLLRGPLYEASAHLAVIPERARMIVSPDPKTGTLTEAANEHDLNSEVALLRSDQLLRDVAQSHPHSALAADEPQGLGGIVRGLMTVPGDLYRSMHGVTSDPLDWEVREIRERLEIQPVKMSNLIRISYREADPERAAAVVNALAERHVTRPTVAQGDARQFFERQQEVLYASRREAEQELRTFYEREGIGSPPENEAALREQLLQLQATAVKARTGLAEAEARTQFLQAELQRHPKTVRAKPAAGATSDPVQLIRARIVELELERSKLLGQFSPTSSRIQDVERQLAQARRIQEREAREMQGILSQTRESLELALAKTEAEAAGLRARVETVGSQTERDQARLAHLEQVASERERLEQEVAAAREALQTYRRKQEEARFSSDLDRARIVNVSIVEPARVPTAPIPSTRMAAGLLGALFSLFAGIGFAFIRDRLDPSIKSTAEATQVAGVPVLADMTC